MFAYIEANLKLSSSYLLALLAFPEHAQSSLHGHHAQTAETWKVNKFQHIFLKAGGGEKLYYIHSKRYR